MQQTCRTEDCILESAQDLACSVKWMLCDLYGRGWLIIAGDYIYPDARQLIVLSLHRFFHTAQL